MYFTSLPFLVLVLATLALYHLPPLRRAQIGLLIVASFLFYGWGQPALTALLVFSCAINTVCSWQVLSLPAGAPRRRLLWAVGGVAANLAVLLFFKYGRLIAGLFIGDLAHYDGPGALLLALPLPVGISFFTFQGISLLIDVYRARRDGVDPCVAAPSLRAHAVNVFFFKSFFPQLVAGPIVKAHEFWGQIRAKSVADIDPGFAGRSLIMGYFLKMVVADNLKDQTYWIQFPLFTHRSGIDLVVLLVAYSMQIFADFAGYSLIAIGLAALFGYRLPDNFNFPYIAQSASEFWRRWHISLSSWLREYLYFPLGGNRKGELRTYVNLVLVMVLGGLWHGAAWSYMVWGAWHGMALAIERPFLRTWWFTTANPVVQALRALAVFTWVTAAWLLFKLPEFGQARAYVASVGGNIHLPATPKLLLVVGLLSAPVLIYHAAYVVERARPGLLAPLRLPAYALMLALTVLNSGTTQAFIYFQF
jgi:alginate O-acetyltransferase complex protein AlgI